MSPFAEYHSIAQIKTGSVCYALITDIVPGIFLGEEGDRCVKMTASSPYVRRLSKKCERFEVSKPYAGVVILSIINVYYVNATRGMNE
jgi:hypothetical protein